VSGPIFGWVDTKVYDQALAQTHDDVKAEQASVGWCGQVVDTNGDGKITRPWNVSGGRDSGLYAGDTQGGGGVQANGGRRGAAGGGGRGGGATAPSLVTMGSFSPFGVTSDPGHHSSWLVH